MEVRRINRKTIHNSIFIVAFALLMNLFYSCDKVEKPWTLNSKIEIAEVPEAYLYKVNVDRTDSLIDSTSISNHNFSFNGLNNSDNISIYRIKFSKGHGDGLTVLVKNGDEISVEILGEYKSVYTGNEIQSDYSKYLQTKQKEVDLMKELMTRIDPKATPEQLEASRKWYTDNTKSIIQEKADFISKINNSELNAYLALDEILTSSIADRDKFEVFTNSLAISV